MNDNRIHENYRISLKRDKQWADDHFLLTSSNTFWLLVKEQERRKKKGKERWRLKKRRKERKRRGKRGKGKNKCKGEGRKEKHFKRCIELEKNKLKGQGKKMEGKITPWSHSSHSNMYQEWTQYWGAVLQYHLPDSPGLGKDSLMKGTEDGKGGACPPEHKWIHQDKSQRKRSTWNDLEPCSGIKQVADEFLYYVAQVIRVKKHLGRQGKATVHLIFRLLWKR